MVNSKEKTPALGSKHKDKPREEIVAMAEEILSAADGKAKVYFKFTCAHCNARQTFQEENTLYDTGTCEACGKVTTITEAGFMLVLSMEGRKRNDNADVS